MVGSVTVLNKTCVCVAVGVGLGEGDFRPIASASAPPGRCGASVGGADPLKMVRAAQASPDHGFCGVRARAGDHSCLELR